jgi:uncharacterized iron-regulated protein
LEKVFWDLKTRFRKALTVKNKIILVMEALQKDENKSYSEVFENLAETSTEFQKKLNELKNDYKGLD